MRTRRLMHVHEIESAARLATVDAGNHVLHRRPWYRPRQWLADMLAESYHRGRADMARDVLRGHGMFTKQADGKPAPRECLTAGAT